MTTRFANPKKLAGMAAIATMVTATGLGFGSGTAQADTTMSDPHDDVVRIFDRVSDRIDRNLDFVSDRIDRNLDFVSDRIDRRIDRKCDRIDRRIDRHFEGTLLDRTVEHFCDGM